MTQHFWKRHLACAALIVAPVLTGGGAAFALPPGAAPPSPADVQRATSLFVRATELFKTRRFVPALEQFKQSYALVASPNSHLYMARCLAAIGESRAAWLEFDRTAGEASADGPKYAPTHDSALQERDELLSKLALVTVAVQAGDPAMSVKVGVYEVPPDRWGKPYPIEPGTVDVVVQVPGRAPVVQQVTVRRGERREVAINGAALGPVAGPGVGPGPGGGGGGGGSPSGGGVNGLRIGAFVAAGIGVAGFALFGAEGSMSSSTYNSLNTTCGGKAGCPAAASDRTTVNNLISTGKSQQLLANVGLGIGIAGVAAGATLFVLSLRKRPASDAGGPSADLVVGPTWLGARGAF
jgi:hypothetical protein